MVGDVSPGVPGPYFELVGPDGMVYPHSQSVKMLGMVGNVKALGWGGDFGGSDRASRSTPDIDIAGSVKQQVQQSQQWASPSGGTSGQGAETSQAATQAAQTASSAARYVGDAAKEMSKTGAETSAAQRETVDIQRALLEETRGLRRDMQQLQMRTVAEIAKAMSA